MRPRKLLLLAALLSLSLPARAETLEDLIGALRRASTRNLTGQTEISVFFPPRDEPVREARALPNLPFSPQLMRRNFDLAVTQDDTVAGRQAVRYDLTPRQGSAARWTFWVDAEYELPLAFEERAADGTLLRRATYLSLEGKPRRRAKPLPQRVFTLRGPLEGAARQALPGLQLPPGFRVVDLQRGRRAGVDTLELLLSDGLNVVPVVLTSRAVRGGPGVRARQFGGNWVWVVGNLPDHTLEAMLKNLHGPLDPQSLGTFLNRADSNP